MSQETNDKQTPKQSDFMIVGMTVAPRNPSTVSKSLMSMVQSWFTWPFYLFAEPDEKAKKWEEFSYIENEITNFIFDLINFEYDENMSREKRVDLFIQNFKNIIDTKFPNWIPAVVLKKNPKKLWCFWNYHNMLSYLFARAKDERIPYILTTQDDYEYIPEAYSKVRDLINYPTLFGYANLITRPRMERYISKNWRNFFDLWRKSRWVNYFYNTNVVWEILRHPFYLSHLHTYTKNQQVDAAISYTLSLLKLPMRYHNPSLSTHFWESTIEHIDNVPNQTVDVKYTKRVVWVASIPNREDNLKSMIESVFHQVDEINVYLNWYKEVPRFLKTSDKIIVHNQPAWDLWDVWKFYKYEDYCDDDVYYFACDDDLIYSNWYFDKLIQDIEKYNREAIVWFHWVVLKNKWRIKSYYEDRYVFPFWNKIPTDISVQIIGTGTIAFHTSTIKFSYKDLDIPNMADVFIWRFAQLLWIPMVCVGRDKHYLSQQTTNTSIYESKNKVDNEWKKVKNKWDEEKIIRSIAWETNYINQVLD